MSSMTSVVPLLLVHHNHQHIGGLKARLPVAVDSLFTVWGAMLPKILITFTPDSWSQLLISLSRLLTSVSILLKILICCAS